MRIYVKCDRCQKEGVPKRNYSGGGQGIGGMGGGWQGQDYFGTIKPVQYVTMNDEPPEGWSKATLLSSIYLLCGECATAIDGIIRGALTPPVST